VGESGRGAGEAETERGGAGGIRGTGRRFAGNNGLRKTGIGTYCSLENHSLGVWVRLEQSDPLKNSSRLSLLMFDACLPFVCCMVTPKGLTGTA